MNRIFNDLVALFDWRTGMVLRRNAKVYMRNWKTAFLPPAMEPVIFFMAFGMGLGAFIGMMNYEGHEVEYGTYVAPGLLAYTSFSSSFFRGALWFLHQDVLPENLGRYAWNSTGTSAHPLG